MIKKINKNFKKCIEGLLLTILLPVFLIMSFLNTCGQGEEQKSGIMGEIILGPLEPVDTSETTGKNHRPYQATVIVKTEDGLQEITRFSSDNNGTFRVVLPPGTYFLEPLPGGSGDSPLPVAKNQIVKVEPNKFTEIQIYYETGVL